MSHQEICNLTAVEMAKMMRAKQLSAREVMEAHLTQIDRVNPKVNAIVTLHPELGLKALTRRLSKDTLSSTWPAS